MINLYQKISDLGCRYLRQKLSATGCGMVVYNEEKFVTFFLDGNINYGNINYGPDRIRCSGDARWKGEKNGIITLDELIDNIKKYYKLI